jgi:hypothetical protein
MLLLLAGWRHRWRSVQDIRFHYVILLYNGSSEERLLIYILQLSRALDLVQYGGTPLDWFSPCSHITEVQGFIF